MKKAFIPQMEPWFDAKEASAVYRYMKNGGWITEYEQTKKLESMIADFIKSKNCIMVNNGTVSLTLAILALGIKPNDEILIPDITMIASPNSALLIGVKPVFVDIETKTLCMDLKDAESKITSKTKALMYVAFNGRCGNMNKVRTFCRENKLYLIEDSAQALGSYFQNKHLGTFGDIGSFSFSVPKIITTGQGGAVVTNNSKLADKVRKMKDFGRDRGGIDFHPYLGWNFKFTDIQAVIGIEQMKKLKSRMKRKKEIYKQYINGLKDIKEINLIPTNLKKTTPWFIDIFVANPDRLAKYLLKKGIGTRRIYPAIHTQKVYQKFGSDKKFPVAAKIASEGLWLPSSTKLTRQNIDYIIKSIRAFFRK